MTLFFETLRAKKKNRLEQFWTKDKICLDTSDHDTRDAEVFGLINVIYLRWGFIGNNQKTENVGSYLVFQPELGIYYWFINCLHNNKKKTILFISILRRLFYLFII